jgi:hypothetical protein
MNRPLLTLLAALLLASSSQAATLSYTNSATALTNDVAQNLLLSQFNTGLGTLTGVAVTVVFLKDGGSFTVTANSGGSVTIDDGASALRALMQLNDPTGTLGFTGYSNSSYAFFTTPEARGLTVSDPQGTNLASPATFVVNTNAIVASTSTNIASGFWAAYQGLGNVAFTLKQNPTIFFSTSGNGGSINTAPFIAEAQMFVTYNYDPVAVPEPSTAVAGALVAAVGLVVGLRRRLARA